MQQHAGHVGTQQQRLWLQAGPLCTPVHASKAWGKASKCRPCGSWRCPSRHSYVWSHACTTAGPQMPVVLSCCAVCADCCYRWSVAADHRGAGNQHGQCYHHQWLSEGGIQAVSTVLWAPAIGNSAVLAGSLVVWFSFSKTDKIAQACTCVRMHASIRPEGA